MKFVINSNNKLSISFNFQCYYDFNFFVCVFISILLGKWKKGFKIKDDLVNLIIFSRHEVEPFKLTFMQAK